MNEIKYYILTVNGTQKFLIVSSADDFDEQMRQWIEDGTRVYGDELCYKSIIEEKFETTGKSSIIILKNAATLRWEVAECVEDGWVVA